jgi:hypothetical protein
MVIKRKMGFYEKYKRMKYRSFILVLFCCLLQFSANSQENWVLKKDKNGIKVFSRKTKNFKFDELKVECELDGRISQLVAVLLDVNRHTDWVYKITKSQLIKKITDGDIYFYNEIECPWPFQNRDLVIHMILSQNIKSKILTIEAGNVNDLLGDKKHIVRVKYSKANWIITPLANKKFRIEYRIQIDPGEGVPAWILNIFASNGPYDTFSKLKEEIKLPQYVQAKFTFIAD